MRAEKIQVRWEGMFQGTGHDVEGGSKRTGADPFWYIQYTERTEQPFGVGIKRYGTSQCG